MVPNLSNIPADVRLTANSLQGGTLMAVLFVGWQMTQQINSVENKVETTQQSVQVMQKKVEELSTELQRTKESTLEKQEFREFQATQNRRNGAARSAINSILTCMRRGKRVCDLGTEYAN